MADNDLGTGTGASAGPNTNDSPGHVNLRVAYLLTGNPRPHQSLGRVSLSTTIASLRNRIQSELPEHPPPHLQRLIYQGRRLQHDEATLGEILKLNGSTPPGPLPYTIHIIINSDQQPSPTLRQAASTHHPPAPLHNTHNADVNPITAAQTSAAGLQEALSRIQQSIETNGADLRSVQQRIGRQHQNLANPPTPPHAHNRTQTQPGGGPGPGPTFAFPTNPPGFPMPLHLPQLPALPPNFIPGHANIPAVQAALEQHRQHLQQHGIPGWPPIAPHPLGHMHNAPAPARGGNPTVHPAPHLTPSNPQVQSIQGPNGERMTVVTDHVSLRIPIQRPASAPGQAPERLQQARPLVPSPHPINPPVRAQPLPMTAPVPSLPFHLPMPFSHAQTAAPNQASSTLAWVLSSPAGPHALLFAPNHGYFSSSNLNTQSTHPASQITNIQVTTSDPSHPAQAPNTTVAAQRDGNDNLALVRQGQRAAAAGPARVQAQQNPQDNDLFAFLIQRGWLFLRLYLFMFIFSEPGTWKRWLMIVLAAVICLQPRDGPLTRALTAARQYFDNLIGPAVPRPPAQPIAQGRPAQDTQRTLESDRTTQRPTHVRGAIQMTPEEAAARILREHQNQHQNQDPSFWQNTFHRVEQSVALFLASLIPGVGERHVRAREEARRLAQRIEEEERQRAEEAVAPQQENHPGALGGEPTSDSATNLDVKEDGPSEPGTSSGVQVRDATAEGGELRGRTT
ncbi:uncharacterized protein A1O9_10615 [Exophiala aquamarina CBS 119918]|uniref:Ubiquitin-like domain-containing protein n=1 Tax=Exophiala aquamarina CBS 119918 TaxID=1182545 RepID=A0A072P0F4_9EURO|nr:uncharacterized protein A1O9_10615 [Exophiala aquamarina CBS 119918]KEF53167.1 hypothetical protein A1O9_10615 [Exophiala aquamarina CBS 119918]